ncbi:MAG: DUF6786 family protein [Planctomycetota bacterium]|jgi:hypothetical protein
MTMIRTRPALLLATLGALLWGCDAMPTTSPTFADDATFLREHSDAIVLGDGHGPGVVVVPAWQGRVMTSTAGGDAGASYGWINRELIASGRLQPRFNAFGGEDRFWFGPEAGQYGLFFAPGDPFDLDHWQTPPVIDTEPFELVSRGDRHASFRRRTSLVNYTGTRFDVRVDRTVTLLAPETAAGRLGVSVAPGVRFVAYESSNTITNVGEAPWTRDGGLLSIWILGMFRPSPMTTVIIPYRDGDPADLGPVVNDAYFGPVPPERLVVRDGVVLFRADGLQRGKIGLGPKRARSVLGSFDARDGVLTIVQYDLPGASEYVSSLWEIQDDPYGGDVVNSYNDGPLTPGEAGLGGFYELETSSPAAALAPGASLTHVHRTFHFEGDVTALDDIARAVLRIDLDTVRNAF